MASKTRSQSRRPAAARRAQEQARQRARRRWLSLGAVLAAAVALVAGIVFTVGGEERGVAAVSPREASELIDTHRGEPGFVILDVRTPAEFSAGRLVGATNIDIEAADFRQRVATLSRDDAYLVYCRSGNRSARATEQMRDLGFTHVYDVQGGIIAWQQAGLPVTT